VPHSVVLPVIFRGHDEAGFFAHAVGLGAGASPLRVLPDNQRTAEARYACLIVVKDYFRLRNESHATGSWHYSRLEPEILVDVRAGRAVLVFDLSNEGPAYDPEIFRPLCDWIEKNHLPAGRCIWLAQNRSMAKAAAADLGPRAGLIEFEHYDYFVKLMAWQFSPRGDAGNDEAKMDGYLERLLEVQHKDRVLLCLNATPRLTRVLTVAALHHHQLLHRSLVSFPGMHYVKSGASVTEVLRFLDNNPVLEHLRPWVHAVGRMPPLRVDEFQEQGNALVEKIDRRAYERTFLSLVTESDFIEPGIARVTEKTVKAFCLGHPTLIIGNAHSVELMRGFGFEDWSHVFDRRAEATPCPATRFVQVFAELLRQAQSIKADPAVWLEAVREISVSNHRYAASGEFLRHYVERFDRRLMTRMQALIAG
jgi:Arc/MetJ family transcription regulator